MCIAFDSWQESEMSNVAKYPLNKTEIWLPLKSIWDPGWDLEQVCSDHLISSQEKLRAIVRNSLSMR
jgi:hypothetical protein